MTAAPVGALAAALAKVQAALPVVHKGKTANVGQYKYDYADLADVTAAIMPLLAKNGLAFTCHPRIDEHGRGYELAATLMHESGETITGALPIAGTAQQLGSAITYARRYLLGSMTGVVTDSDDDARMATQAQKEAARETRKAAVEESLPRITAQQSKRVHALLGEVGVTERDKYIALAAWHTGRDVTSTSDLTKVEAGAFIDYLATRAADMKKEVGGSGDE